MKIGLPLKLAIGIVVVFGLLFTGMALYRPFMFRYHTWRLKSSDPAVREATVRTLAVKGKAALPYVRKWLASENDVLIEGALSVIEKMPADTWTKALGDLETVLEGPVSRHTDHAVKILINHKFPWKSTYKNNPSILASFYSYYLLYGKMPMPINRGKSNLNSTYCVDTYGLFGNWDRIETCNNAVWHLGRIRHRKAVPRIVVVMQKNSAPDMRKSAASALGIIGDYTTIRPLIHALEKDGNMLVREKAAIALAGFDRSDIDSVLEAAAGKKNMGAEVALAWRKGRIIKDNRFGKKPYLRELLEFSKLRWGDISKLSIIKRLDYTSYYLEPFFSDIISRMPEGFPEVDFYANRVTRRRQKKQTRNWLRKNRDRIVWNSKERRYFLYEQKK
jgi:hypothetical protein